MRIAVVCSVKDEGPFLVEWITWYRMLGFNRIVVVTNDCTDHSPALLDAFAAAGWLTHLRCDIPPGASITGTKLALARAAPAVFRSDWVFVCDVDEFLIVHVGGNRVQDLIAYPEEPFLGMSINWRVFGDSGQSHWQDGLMHRQFDHAAMPDDSSVRWFKALFRQPRWFASLGEHGPRRLNLKRAAAPWGSPGMRWINTDGVPVRNWSPDGAYARMLHMDQTAQNVAQLNHYMIRAQESFNLKRGSPAPVSGIDRYNDGYEKQFNRNDMHEDSALIYRDRFDALHAAAMALPGVARLHHHCCADYVARLCAKAGIATADDPRWQDHMDRAAAAI